MTTVYLDRACASRCSANFESVHAQRWLRFFVEHGHDMHAISYYRPASDLRAAPCHVVHVPVPGAAAGGLEPAVKVARLDFQSAALRDASPSWAAIPACRTWGRTAPHPAGRLPRPLRRRARFLRRLNGRAALRGERLGLGPATRFYTTLGRLIGALDLRHADFVTVTTVPWPSRVEELGVEPENVEVIRLGVELVFLGAVPSTSAKLCRGSGRTSSATERWSPCIASEQ